MLRSTALVLSAALFVATAGCGNPSGTLGETNSTAAGNAQDASTTAAASDAAGQVDLQVMDYEGVQKLIASKKGQVVVLDCWSTSCGPCVEEFPNLVALQKKHGDKLACISLSFDYNGLGSVDDVKGDVLAFLREQGATFDNVISSESDEELSKKFGFAAIPVVYVYDQQGKMVKRFDNESAETEEDLFTYEDVSALVEELLKKQG